MIINDNLLMNELNLQADSVIVSVTVAHSHALDAINQATSLEIVLNKEATRMTIAVVVVVDFHALDAMKLDTRQETAPMTEIG